MRLDLVVVRSPMEEIALRRFMITRSRLAVGEPTAAVLGVVWRSVLGG